MRQCWSRKSCTEICSADRLLAIRDSLHVVLNSFLIQQVFSPDFWRRGSNTTSPRGERVHRVAQSEGDDPHGCAASLTPGSAPLLFLRSVSLPPPVLPTRRRRYFKCRCGFTPTTSSPVKRAINHPPPSRRHLRLQDPDSRLRGGNVSYILRPIIQSVSPFFKTQQNVSSTCNDSRVPKTKKKKKTQNKTRQGSSCCFSISFSC